MLADFINSEIPLYLYPCPINKTIFPGILNLFLKPCGLGLSDITGPVPVINILSAFTPSPCIFLFHTESGQINRLPYGKARGIL